MDEDEAAVCRILKTRLRLLCSNSMIYKSVCWMYFHSQECARRLKLIKMRTQNSTSQSKTAQLTRPSLSSGQFKMLIGRLEAALG